MIKHVDCLEPIELVFSVSVWFLIKIVAEYGRGRKQLVDSSRELCDICRSVHLWKIKIVTLLENLKAI